MFYFSRHCNDYEAKYHSYELEVLAIVETLERFRIYLVGKFFRVVTDCAAVTTTKLSKPLLPRIARWWLRLQEFDFELVHRPGQQIQHVDALSRAPNEPSSTPEVVADKVYRIEIDEDDWLATMQHQDESLCDIMKILRGELKTDQTSQIKKDYVIKRNRLFRNVNGKEKWVVPSAVRWQIVRNAHDERGHFGIDKTLSRIQLYYWFKRMRNYVKSYINSCIQCCYNKRPGGAIGEQLHISPIIPIPFRIVHVDHVGSFPKSTKGNLYIIGIADEFSTQPVICMFNEMSTYFGLPTIIVSDRGTAFTAVAFEKYCKDNDIQHVKNAVRTPKANGQIERINRTILMFLRTSTEIQSKWDMKMDQFQFSINSQVNDTIKCAPNDVVFRYTLHIT